MATEIAPNPEKKSTIETLSEAINQTLNELDDRMLVHPRDAGISSILNPLRSLQALLCDTLHAVKESVNNTALAQSFNRLMPGYSTEERIDLCVAQEIGKETMKEIADLMHKAKKMVAKLDEDFSTETRSALAHAEHALNAAPLKPRYGIK